MATQDAFLSVSGVGPEPAKRVLSPLVEDEAEEEQEDGYDMPEHPKFYPTDTNGDLLFLTEDITEYGDSLQNEESATGDDGRVRVESKVSRLSYYVDKQGSDNDSLDDVDCVSDVSFHSRDDDYETDLEVDEERLLHPERFDRDLTGKDKYIKVCEDMGISPTTYFVKHIQDRELKMKFHGLGPQRMKAISVPLQTNTNIEILNLEGNAIDSDGAVCLTKVLRENFFITDLLLADNKIGTAGGIALSSMLVDNRNLVKVDLTGNDIGNGAAQGFSDVILNNKNLKILLLGHNRFEDAGAKLFKLAIADNSTLDVLDLSWNHFSTKGAICLAEGIQENVGLKSFNMAMAGLGKQGSVAISKALKENRTLLELNISMNRIPLEGANIIAQGIKENDTLKVLKIGSNPFDSDGAMVILETLDGNSNSSINELDFSNIMVKTSFARLQMQLQEKRNMTIINEGIIPEFPRTNSARLTAFRVDPLGMFKVSAYKAGVDLADVLLPIGDDFTMEVKEFKELIKSLDMGVTDDQIATVARRLNQDGKVYFRPLLDMPDIDEEEVFEYDGTEHESDRSEVTISLDDSRPVLGPRRATVN
ncbi:hypothetical protein ACJMK2_037575 [Sinanodonta woodiana]|uniref:Uncharacterized protein n=1 Tax=Sinanodonta woodiana TaxID=1069815 RepID=A0ABD3WL90_SINWO